MTDQSRSTVYLDHAATSWPKPPDVVDAMVATMADAGANPGRGAYAMALAASRTVYEARRAVAGLLGAPDPRQVLFLSGATEACNLMLKGLLGPGDLVLVSPMEHNAVTRPLHVLAGRGVEVGTLPADEYGIVDLDGAERLVRRRPPRAIVCQHASNVTGLVQPVADLSDIAHEMGALLLVDGAQGVGHVAVDLTAIGADAYAASGHKGLLGPQGVGILHLREGLRAQTLIEGGTGGGSSDDDEPPAEGPERYEAGTPNTPGIAGAGAAARLLTETGAETRREEQRLARALCEGILGLPGVRVLRPDGDHEAVPIVSFVAAGLEPDRIAFELDRRWGIAVRSGLHCAPAAHRHLGTIGSGAVRVSLGYGNTDGHVAAVLDALRTLLS